MHQCLQILHYSTVPKSNQWSVIGTRPKHVDEALRGTHCHGYVVACKVGLAPPLFTTQADCHNCCITTAYSEGDWGNDHSKCLSVTMLQAIVICIA